MKRIKTVNGYVIYEATSARDEANYNCGIGHYNLYLSSDIRDFGLSNSYPDYEDVDSMAVAIAYANGSQFAVATALAWELCDSTAEDTALRDEIERRLEAGQSIDYIRECYDTDEQHFDPELDWMERAAQHSDEPHDFCDDEEKMRDFAFLSKEEFLASYSYLTEAEYDATAAKVRSTEYTHVEPISRDRMADLFDYLLGYIIDTEYEDGDLVETLRGLCLSDDEIRACCGDLVDGDPRLAPVGLDRGGATPRDVEYSDGSFGVEQPRWRVYYEGDIFPEDHYVRGSVGITREYWDGDKARSLRDYCEKHHVPVWLDDTYYGVTEHDGNCY